MIGIDRNIKEIKIDIAEDNRENKSSDERQRSKFSRESKRKRQRVVKLLRISDGKTRGEWPGDFIIGFQIILYYGRMYVLQIFVRYLFENLLLSILYI